jgi:hypothetical protein
VHGSGALIRWLLDNDLVDEFAFDALHKFQRLIQVVPPFTGVAVISPVGFVT